MIRRMARGFQFHKTPPGISGCLPHGAEKFLRAHVRGTGTGQQQSVPRELLDAITGQPGVSTNGPGTFGLAFGE